MKPERAMRFLWRLHRADNSRSTTVDHSVKDEINVYMNMMSPGDSTVGSFAGRRDTSRGEMVWGESNEITVRSWHNVQGDRIT